MSYWNWYFLCPYCDEEADCHIEENDGDDRFWLTAELPDECPLCNADLRADHLKLEEEACEHYSQRNEKEYDPELTELEYEDYGNPYFIHRENNNTVGALRFKE